ncbi:hypothetical protein [Fulvivirga ligni]|uniref:hypothetical protein n=1 Tax=Fulvivirga ligni TaxID=2904246 RepID=UPI001F3D22C5|nr:hypothetical protein [Fulvivirga ligni]UII20728.1 hypothetical protein LVD16_23075 [Fulvivirga ligni]
MPINSEIAKKVLDTKKPHYNLFPEFKGYLNMSIRLGALILIVGFLLFKAFLIPVIISLLIVSLTGLIYLYLNWSFKKNIKLIEINTRRSKSENYEAVLNIRRNLDWGIKVNEGFYLTFYDDNTALKGGEIVCVFEDNSIYFYCVRISQLWPFKHYSDESYEEFENAIEHELANQ